MVGIKCIKINFTLCQTQHGAQVLSRTRESAKRKWRWTIQGQRSLYARFDGPKCWETCSLFSTASKGVILTNCPCWRVCSACELCEKMILQIILPSFYDSTLPTTRKMIFLKPFNMMLDHHLHLYIPKAVDWNVAKVSFSSNLFREKHVQYAGIRFLTLRLATLKRDSPRHPDSNAFTPTHCLLNVFSPTYPRPRVLVLNLVFCSMCIFLINHKAIANICACAKSWNEVYTT